MVSAGPLLLRIRERFPDCLHSLIPFTFNPNVNRRLSASIVPVVAIQAPAIEHPLNTPISRLNLRVIRKPAAQAQVRLQ